MRYGTLQTTIREAYMTTKAKFTPYRQEDVAQLISLWNSGATTTDIATALQRGVTSIRNKIRALQKSGVLGIRARDTSTTIPAATEHAPPTAPAVAHIHDYTTLITLTQGAYDLPDGYVEYFMGEIIRMMGEEVLANRELFSDMVTECCTAWYTQSAECYYLGQACSMTIAPSPTQAVLMTGADGELVFVSRAIARMRGTLAHSTFVRICGVVATAWS